MRTRKVIALFVVVGTLAAAGAAFAGGARRFRGCPCEGQDFNYNQQSPRMMQGYQGQPCQPDRPEQFARQGQTGSQGPRMMQGRQGQFTRQGRPQFMNFRRGFAPQQGQPKPFIQPDGYGKPVRFAPDMPDEIRAKAADAAKLRIDLDNVISKRPLDKAKAAEIYANIDKLESEIRVWRFNQKLDMIEKREEAAKARAAANNPEAPEEPEQQPAPEEPEAPEQQD